MKYHWTKINIRAEKYINGHVTENNKKSKASEDTLLSERTGSDPTTSVQSRIFRAVEGGCALRRSMRISQVAETDNSHKYTS